MNNHRVPRLPDLSLTSGGGGGIRTLGRISPTQL
jgi:hypothetical protein